jgi:hypothetical protein
MLIEDGDLEMARMWTLVMHASARLTATFPIHGAPRH